MSTKFAMLGLLNLKPMSAYELERFAKESIGYFWNESYSNVHRTLKLLADAKLVKRIPETGSRNKVTYQITSNGKHALSEWLSNHQNSSIYRDELLLKLFVSGRNDYPAILEDLRLTLDELSAQNDVYYEIKKSLADIPDNLSYDLAVDYGIMQGATAIEWIKTAIERIEESL